MKRPDLAWLFVAALAATPAAAAPAAAAQVDIRPGALRDALAELARENGVEILFDAALVRGKASQAVRGRFSPDQAMTLLLAGTGLGFRATPDGAYVLFERPGALVADPGDGAIAELLVVGRRTQNADIRRTENDIQPYQVIGLRELAMATQGSLDEHLRERLPTNAQAVSPRQDILAGAAANSALNLRGVGVQRTLVLIDGRRIPSLPTDFAGLNQGDINAVPLGAIERIETLTGAAGGIHGPSAVGGVVNVVLRRDYRGAELTAATGLSGRGDAGRVRLEGRIGVSPDGGATEMMLFAAYSKAQPLKAGDRDFAERSVQRQTANAADWFLTGGAPLDGITVQTVSGAPLRLDPAYGGATLSSSHTFIPLGLSGSAENNTAVLIANSGRLPTGAAPGANGAGSSLLATPESSAVLLNVRRRLSDGIEVFADGFQLRNRAEAVLPNLLPGNSARAAAVNNPFAQEVYFTFPTSNLFTSETSEIEVRRGTLGVIARLPRDWRASADYTLGRTLFTTHRRARILGSGFGQSLWMGVPGAEGQPTPEPLGDYAAFQAAIDAHAVEATSDMRLVNRFRDAAVRAAGPVATLPGGPLTLTLLAETRREHMPETLRRGLSEGGAFDSLTPARTQTVRSGYVELRAPLVPRDTGFGPARGLEIQVALRRDAVKTTFPENVLGDTTLRQGETTIRHEANVFTIGGRMFPADWLMLRGSLATGEAPPDLRHLQERQIRISFDYPDEPADPKRGGRRVTQDGSYLWIRDGSHLIRQEKGRTLSAGLVLNPDGGDWPRLAVDYSRMEVNDEIVPLNMSVQQLLDAEATYPDRVDRDPLSAADAALGYTAGRVTALRVGLINGGRTVTETIDAQLDWTFPPTAYGQGRFYATATWQPTFRSRIVQGGPMIERAGYRDGPLKWRGNAGLEWTRGPLTLDLNLQFFARHRVASSAADIVRVSAQRVALQGEAYFPSQAYVDLAARRRFELSPNSPVRAVEARLGVQNLLDRSPPIVADFNSPGYSYYGDPRRRRFEFMLSARF